MPISVLDIAIVIYVCIAFAVFIYFPFLAIRALVQWIARRRRS